MAFYAPQSFYETTLASAITATDTTIPVTVAPNITSGYLVIESSTSNREIIKYTGVTGTNLTGCVRGLASYGSDDSGGSGTAHSAGVDIANKDVHYYYAQYFDFLTGTSASGYNTLKFGDGNTISASDRLIYLNTSSISAFFGLSSSGAFVISENGTDSYVVSAGGSGVTAGDGIDITGGVVSVDALSTGGIQVSANKIKVGYDGDALKATSAGEIYLDKTTDYTWTGDHTANGRLSISASPVSADHVATKEYVDGYTNYTYTTASDELQHSADTPRGQTNLGTYTKFKEIQVYHPGTYRIKFDMLGYGSYSDSYGRVYKNGTGFGTEFVSGSQTYVTHSEDLTFDSGDLVQLYLRNAGGSASYGTSCRNFRLYYDVTTTSAYGDVITD